MKRALLVVGVCVGCLPGAVVALTSGSGRGRPAAPALVAAARPAAASLGLKPDPEAAQSFPATASTPRPPDPATPAHVAATTRVAPGAPSDAQIRQELRQMHAAVRSQQPRPVPATPQGGGYVAPQGQAQAPAGAPLAVARVIAAGNAIADYPYIWGGGHASFVDNGYDCSGSVSYALAAAGLVSRPLVSGEFMRWGVPGPGKWISVMASDGHVYMYVAGLRFDTSGRSGPLGSRWQAASRDNSGFVVRHWPGL